MMNEIIGRTKYRYGTVSGGRADGTRDKLGNIGTKDRDERKGSQTRDHQAGQQQTV